jgi:hypothetical protein
MGAIDLKKISRKYMARANEKISGKGEWKHQWLCRKS